jgi:hypothetical protein
MENDFQVIDYFIFLAYLKKFRYILFVLTNLYALKIAYLIY